MAFILALLFSAVFSSNECVVSFNRTREVVYEYLDSELCLQRRHLINARTTFFTLRPHNINSIKRTYRLFVH